MKRFYLKFGIFPLTFVIGWACVSFFDDIRQNFKEYQQKQVVYSINLPQVESKTPIIVYPKYRHEMHITISAGCGGREEIAAKPFRKKVRRR